MDTLKNFFKTVKILLMVIGTLLIGVPIIMAAMWAVPVILIIFTGGILFLVYKILFFSDEDTDLLE